MTTNTRYRKGKRCTYRPLLRRRLLLGLILSMLVGGIGYWGSAHIPHPSTVRPGSGETAYTVLPGDSLNAIAARFGVSASAIVAANGIANPNLVVSGTRLLIPAGSVLSGVPNDRHGVQQLIVSYAQLYGVQPALALALAWQESGFNETMVSRTGALGVMQVEPDTGVTIANLLGRPLDLHSVRDNVQAGVYWLARLDAMYSGNQRLAAAAYYQGALSVSRDGLYRDTVQYVNNVMALEVRFEG